MNKNQIILSALESQSESKTIEVENYRKSVYEPARKVLNEEVLQWFKDNVSSLILSLDVSTDHINIHGMDRRGYGSCNIYFNYVDYKSKTKYAKMSWYSSSATVQDNNTLTDVQIFGAVAANLAKIEDTMINTWSNTICEIEKGMYAHESNLSQINSSIQQIKNEIRLEEINKYKEVGFECQLSPEYYYSYTDNYTDNKILERPQCILMKYSRGRFDYVYITYYKIISKIKDTYILEVKDQKYSEQSNDTKITIKEKYMSEFVAEVYNWQTQGSAKSKANAERYLNK